MCNRLRGGLGHQTWWLGVLIVLVSAGLLGASESTRTLAPKTFSELNERVSAMNGKDPVERIKQAVLALALERAANANAVGLTAEEQALLADVTAALAQPATAFGQRNATAAHLAILKPLLTPTGNPYLEALLKSARKELAKPDVPWKRATATTPVFGNLGGPYGERTAGERMREWFWLFAHEQSPMRGDPECLKRALRRAHAYIDGLELDGPELSSRPNLYDQFAIEMSFSGLYEIIALHPGLLLPSQRVAWDRTLRKASAQVWTMMQKAGAWNLNIETARMVGVLNMGYYTTNQEMIAKVMSHVDAVLKRMRPDGAWPYHGDSNPSVNYHSALTGSLLRIYEQTGYEPIAKALAASQWKGPVMGRTDEFWTSPFYKTYRWNITDRAETGPEAVAALSGNGYLRWMLNRDIAADRDQIAWYRGDVKPIPLPDNYTIPDRNVGGPRAWYGQFTYAGTFRQLPLTLEGHETLMGAMTVDPDTGRLNSILTDVTPRVWMYPKDQIDEKGKMTSTAWGNLAHDLRSATTIGKRISVGTAIHGITSISISSYKGELSDWQGRQVWIGLPDRIIGLVSMVPSKDGAKAYAINGVLRLISGGVAGALETKTLEKIDDRHFRYGQLEIIVHASTFASLTPVMKEYRMSKYPATELTFSNRDSEPKPVGDQTSFPLATDLRFLIEVRPIWTKTAMQVDMIGDRESLGIKAVAQNQALLVWLNASSQERSCLIDRKSLPAGRTSLVMSEGVLGRPTPIAQIPDQVRLKPAQHAVVVVSPDALDHEPGWGSFADMATHAPLAK